MEEIAEQERAMNELDKNWEKKLEEAMLQKKMIESEDENEKKEALKKTVPHIMNINEDPLLSGLITVNIYSLLFIIIFLVIEFY